MGFRKKVMKNLLNYFPGFPEYSINIKSSKNISMFYVDYVD